MLQFLALFYSLAEPGVNTPNAHRVFAILRRMWQKILRLLFEWEICSRFTNKIPNSIGPQTPSKNAQGPAQTEINQAPQMEN